MIGGVATNFRGYQRSTDDINVWIDDTVENGHRFRKVFYEYGLIDMYMIETLQIIPGWTNFNLNNGTNLDLMVNVKGFEGYSFADCLSKASIAEIIDVKVPFLYINHLIESKKAANRPKDQLDVIYLEKIKKLLKDQNKL